MKKYVFVSYDCIAYDECTDNERKYIADCGKPTGNYSVHPSPQADAVEDAINKGRKTEELEQQKKSLLDDRVTAMVA